MHLEDSVCVLVDIAHATRNLSLLGGYVMAIRERFISDALGILLPNTARSSGYISRAITSNLTTCSQLTTSISRKPRMRTFIKRVMSSTTSALPWYASLPAPRATPLQMAVSELKALKDDPARRAGVDYVVVDVRRADMDVSSRKSSASRFPVERECRPV